MSQGQMPAPTLNAFSVMSTWLYAAPVEGSQKRPSIRFGVYGNVPRITVKTGVDGDINHGKIDFKTDLATFAAAMGYARQLIEGKDIPQERIFVHQDDFVGGKKIDKVVPLAKLQIGREPSSGRVYIAVLSTQSSRPRIRFFFGPTKHHDILNGDGTQISPKEMSEAYAYGFLVPAEAIVYNLMVSSFDPNAKNVANPANFGGGNQGGGQRQGGGGNYGGGQRPQGNSYGGGQQGGGRPQQAESFGFDEDIPNF